MVENGDQLDEDYLQIILLEEQLKREQDIARQMTERFITITDDKASQKDQLQLLIYQEQDQVDEAQQNATRAKETFVQAMQKKHRHELLLDFNQDLAN